MVRQDGHFILVIGDNKVAGIPVPNHRIFIDLLSSMGLTLELGLTDRIRSRALMTKRNITADIIDSESILVFKK